MGVLTYFFFKKKKPLSNIRDDKNLIMFLDFFLSLHWPSQKGMFWISEFCLALDTLRYKRRDHLYFPNGGVREASCWPQLGSASQPHSCSGSFVGTSYCFHNTVTVNVPQRLCAGHSPPAATTLLWKQTSPRALTRGKIFSLKVSEASLVQFRVNTYDLAYIKGLLAQRSPIS